MKQGVLYIFIFAVMADISCHAQAAGCTDTVNLVVNPHFDQGNSGFASTLCYGVNCTPGCYYVGTTMQAKCYLWPASFVDHTTGTGNFLLVDGNDTYAPQDVWSQNIQVISNTTYTFSFWAKNLYSQQPFPLAFMIGGIQVAATPTISAGVWSHYSAIWVAPSTTLISIAIRQVTAGAYRDFGVDDVFFGYCQNGSTSLETREQEVSFDIFPNPGNSEFTVSGLDLPAEMAIYNLAGEKILRRYLITEIFQLNLPKGFYFVEILSRGKRNVKKLILE